MFSGCNSLTNAPKLRAKVSSLDSSTNLCYCGMFADCTSLKVAPNLNLKYISYATYTLMFKNCVSITEMPDMVDPITPGEMGYSGMF